MKHLFLARHGEDDNDVLCREGRKQAMALSNAIKEIVGDKTRHVISSSATRAMQSAAILACELTCESFEVYPFLNVDDIAGYNQFLEGNNERLNGIIERYDERSALVVVTHKPVVECFGEYFAKQHEIGLPYKLGERITEGHSAYFDVCGKKFSILP